MISGRATGKIDAGTPEELLVRQLKKKNKEIPQEFLTGAHGGFPEETPGMIPGGFIL